ncbi:MAG: hypothetical protein ABSD29_02760 [Verrucomicrobiota bacterium]|jgi:hypothetical protein
MLDWLNQNKQWVLSGVGIAIVTAVIALLRWLLRRRPPTEVLASIELQQRRQASNPQFHWRDGSSDYATRTCNFENLGGIVSSLTVHTGAPLDISIIPADRLQANHLGSVRFAARAGRIAYPFEFEIRYTTTLEERRTERFRVEACSREPARIQ